jgi:branched-chain amino acid transport system substrate-binding protein
LRTACPNPCLRQAAGRLIEQQEPRSGGSLASKIPNFDGNVLYGMAVGYTFVQAMFKAGRNPTRADLINAINKGLPQNVAVAPFAYSASDHNGIEGAYMGTIKNGVLVPTTGVFTTDDTPTGAITADSTPQPAAPSTGIPSP